MPPVCSSSSGPLQTDGQGPSGPENLLPKVRERWLTFSVSSRYCDRALVSEKGTDE